MKVEVLYFAVLRERTRLDQETVELPAAASVGDARAVIARRHPSVAALLAQVKIAVNRAMADDGRALADGDELALLPPVAGGAARAGIRISAEPVTVEGALAALPEGDHGGVVTFAGIVRRRGHHLPDVVRLEYEAYREMAEAVLGEIADEIEREHPGVRLAIHHRTGALRVGEIAVAIAAAAAHRAPAFEACREAIDRLKARAPIWKKEIGESGEAWVGLGA
ncbi:MAG TPA: molybdopterin converting factor subunit 1 [Polyangia bacterium]|nr:molybdopterin converting factor subunit 1 [Polyangia bacterium]